MELLKDLELGAVEYDDTGKQAVMTFIDYEHGQIRDVKFNKRVYRDGRWIDDGEKAETVEKWCQTYFDTDFEHLTNCIGVKKDVYCYEKFNSLWEVDQISKFTKDDYQELFDTTIKEIVVNEFFIRIRYDWDGKTYESKQTFGKYMPALKKYFNNPNKEALERKKFEEKYGVPVEDAESLVGKPIVVEVKSCFGDNYYGEIKKPGKGW